jgi:hypothetical protein
MTLEKKYDAFLSYNSQDRQLVETIARWLTEDAKLIVWFDQWRNIPGNPWQEDLENALDQSRCCVVFLGPSGLGAWQNEELRVVIDDRISQKSIRIVPVLLPKVPRPEKESRIPKFLRRLNWVAFEEHWNEPETLRKLVCGIKGEAPYYLLQKRGSIICPFRGLEIFREEDTRFFFGREEIIQQFLDYLEEHRLLAVIGPSGSGKSSVIQAGLIPAMKNTYVKNISNTETTIPPIRIAILTPKEHPVEELAFAIQRLDDGAIHVPVEDIIQRLVAHEKGLYYLTREISERTGAERIILIIDQFEELFTQTDNENERKQFLVAMIATLEATYSPLWMILTMRSDFLGKCVVNRDLNT